MKKLTTHQVMTAQNPHYMSGGFKLARSNLSQSKNTREDPKDPIQISPRQSRIS